MRINHLQCSLRILGNKIISNIAVYRFKIKYVHFTKFVCKITIKFTLTAILKQPLKTGPQIYFIINFVTCWHSPLATSRVTFQTMNCNEYITSIKFLLQIYVLMKHHSHISQKHDLPYMSPDYALMEPISWQSRYSDLLHYTNV